MSNTKKYSLIAFVTALAATVAFAAASGDRLKSPVAVGQGLAETLSVFFDTGNSANNARVISTANTDLSLAVNGTSRVTANTTGAEITGIGTATSAFQGPSGSNSVPSFGFTTETTLGLYRKASGRIGIAGGGADIGSISGSDWQHPLGSVSAPSVTFLTDADTGMYQDGANALGFTVGGTRGLSVTATQMQIPGSMQFGSGGFFKVTTFSGSLGSSSTCSGTCTGGACGTTCPTITGTIVGVSGWSQHNSGSFFQPLQYPTGTSGAIAIQTSTASALNLTNEYGSGANTYTAIVFYQ